MPQLEFPIVAELNPTPAAVNLTQVLLWIQVVPVLVTQLGIGAQSVVALVSAASLSIGCGRSHACPLSWPWHFPPAWAVAVAATILSCSELRSVSRAVVHRLSIKPTWLDICYGIVLVFQKPFLVGDIVHVAGERGWFCRKEAGLASAACPVHLTVLKWGSPVHTRTAIQSYVYVPGGRDSVYAPGGRDTIVCVCAAGQG